VIIKATRHRVGAAPLGLPAASVALAPRRRSQYNAARSLAHEVVGMPHPLVTQLRFARSEFVRALDGVSEADGIRRLKPMNCIAWNVGHLAHQEQTYWVYLAQGRVVVPGLRQIVGWGCGPTTPSLAGMWQTWRTVTAAADEYLDTITQEALLTRFEDEDGPVREDVGTMLYRNTYQYSWAQSATSPSPRSP
jgi:hypothetical protein